MPAQVKGKSRVQIRDLDDLVRWIQSEPTPDEVLVLEPSESLLREPSFIDELAESSKVKGALIELQGSPLAHPFYQLTNAGATVLCPTPGRIDMHFDKLVRDNIPASIQESGEHVLAARAADQDLGELLRRKLIEEAFEVAGAESEEDVIEELADLEEVLLALRANLQISASDVEAARQRKLTKRGGFGGGYVLKRTSTREIAEPSQDLLPGLDQTLDDLDIWEIHGDSMTIRLDRAPSRGTLTRIVDMLDGAARITVDLRARELEISAAPMPKENTEILGSDQLPLDGFE